MADSRTTYQRGRILAALDGDSLTAQQLADRLHLTRDAINLHLRAMRNETPRLVHISGHVYNPEGGRPAPKYSPGDKEEATYIPTRQILQGRKNAVEHTLRRVVDLLQRTPMTAVELANALDLAPARARWYINHLRTATLKRVYIKRYVPNFGGYPAPVYAAGNKPDAIYTPKTRKEMYQEEMSDPERRQRALNRNKLRWIVKSTRKKPNGIFAALGI